MRSEGDNWLKMSDEWYRNKKSHESKRKMINLKICDECFGNKKSQRQSSLNINSKFQEEKINLGDQQSKEQLCLLIKRHKNI